jgi:cytochrome oxidase assembly protein ShyY1
VTGWRFALTRRWAGYLALTVVFAVVCSLLGMWQFSRRAEARAEIARIDANYDAAPEPVGAVLPTLDAFDESLKWRPVELQGVYLPDEELLVRNRPLGGRPGFEVLTPLLQADGTVFIVDRGWIPTGEEQDAPDAVPAAPAGPVTVVARLRAGEPTLPGRTTVEGSGEIPTVNLPQIEGLVDGAVYTGAYGLVASEAPKPATAPVPSARPARDEGPHLSYALQWYVFGLLAFVGLGRALLQEYRDVNAEDPDERERAAERARRRAARAPDDAEVEDAILEDDDRSRQASEIRSA